MKLLTDMQSVGRHGNLSINSPNLSTIVNNIINGAAFKIKISQTIKCRLSLVIRQRLGHHSLEETSFKQ